MLYARLNGVLLRCLYLSWFCAIIWNFMINHFVLNIDSILPTNLLIHHWIFQILINHIFIQLILFVNGLLLIFTEIFLLNLGNILCTSICFWSSMAGNTRISLIFLHFLIIVILVVTFRRTSIINILINYLIVYFIKLTVLYFICLLNVFIWW